LTQRDESGTNRFALRRIEAQPSSVVERRGPIRGRRRIDALDQGIIEALQANGREPFRRIAGRLGVSEATVRARYTRLAADNILQVVAVTNPLGLGFEQALVGVKTSGPPQPIADDSWSWARS
jgi:Lrp/AsnC family transcriptional regulator for asnA, asnC and gidA